MTSVMLAVLLPPLVALSAGMDTGNDVDTYHPPSPLAHTAVTSPVRSLLAPGVSMSKPVRTTLHSAAVVGAANTAYSPDAHLHTLTCSTHAGQRMLRAVDESNDGAGAHARMWLPRASQQHRRQFGLGTAAGRVAATVALPSAWQNRTSRMLEASWTCQQRWRGNRASARGGWRLACVAHQQALLIAGRARWGPLTADHWLQHRERREDVDGPSTAATGGRAVLYKTKTSSATPPHSLWQ